MTQPTSDEDWVTYLAVRHDQEMEELERLNGYYEGTQKLSYMHPEVEREIEDRIRPVVIGWPQLVVDAVEERLDVEGFRVPTEDADDEDLWRIWQANDMDEQSQLAHVDALVMKRSYVTVGTNEKDQTTPILAAESPLEMYADVDPRTRTLRAALRRVAVEDTFAKIGDRSATLYLPNTTIWYDWANGWKEKERDNHNLGELPVAAIVNRARLSTNRADRRTFQLRQLGSSELAPVIPISDAANKIATDMMLAAEFLALPVHGFFGIGPEDLEDQQGNKLTAMQALLKRFLTIPTGYDEGAKEFSFPGVNLGGFHESINQLAQIVASLAGLPPHYLGFTTDNPASADAIRSAESRLVKRCERKQRPWGGAYERMCRIVRRFQTGEWDPRLKQLETIWRDPSTPTVSQMADAAQKLYVAPPGQKPILTLRRVRERLGETDASIRRMEAEQAEEDQRAAALDPISVVADALTPPQPPEPAGAVGA
ncbi:phage portal protein [Amycolatopsis sp. NPDC001319]|uniref:phage portal protein n=1 Tax=unclassified Amycolatopsis TaxID=2618356 RepID=UPI003682DA6F